MKERIGRALRLYKESNSAGEGCGCVLVQVWRQHGTGSAAACCRPEDSPSWCRWLLQYKAMASARGRSAGCRGVCYRVNAQHGEGSPHSARAHHLPLLLCQASSPPLPLRPAVIRESMASARPLLQTYPGQFPTAEPPDALSVDSDVEVFPTALLCVVGLTAVTGCACSRRGLGGTIYAARQRRIRGSRRGRSWRYRR